MLTSVLRGLMSVAPPNASGEFATKTDDLDELVGVVVHGASDSAGNRASYSIEQRLGGGGQACIFLAKRSAGGAEDAAVIKIWRPSFVGAQPAIADLVLTKES